MTIVRTTLSVAAHICFLVCLTIVIWAGAWRVEQSSHLHHEHDISLHQYMLAASIVGVLSYAMIVLEAVTSTVYSFLKSYVSDITAEEYIERVQDARPLVRWHATCYHYEIKSEARFHHEQQRGNLSGQNRSKEKIVTLRDTEAFKFSDWKDVTRDVTGLLHRPLIQVQLGCHARVPSLIHDVQ